MPKNITKSGKLKARDLERALYQEFKANARKELNPKQLLRKLKLKNSKDSVQAALDKLVATDKIKVNDQFRYQFNGSAREKRSNTYAEGRVDMTRSGSAYVIMDGDAADIFVPQQRLGNAQDGDKVKVRFWTPGGRRKPEGEVAEVLERSVSHFVGTLRIYEKYAEVVVEGPGRQEA